MIRKIFVALVIGFATLCASGSLFAQQKAVEGTVEQRVTSVEDRLNEHLKNARRARKGQSTKSPQDSVARNGVDELRKMMAASQEATKEDVLELKESDKFFTSEIGKLRTQNENLDSNLSDLQSKVYKEGDDLWYSYLWIWIGVITSAIIGLVGWFLPRPGFMGYFKIPPGAVEESGEHTDTRTRGGSSIIPYPVPPPAKPANQEPVVSAPPAIPLPAATTPKPPVQPVNILAPAPVVLGVSNSIKPNNSPVTGGWAMTVRGSGFQRGARVFFGTNECSNVQWQNADIITVTSPAGEEGLADIRVINPDGQESTMSNGVSFF